MVVLDPNSRPSSPHLHQSSPGQPSLDPSRLGPALLVAASLILAIRTARWPREQLQSSSNPEWQAELEQSITLAHRIFAHLDAKSPFLFRRQP